MISILEEAADTDVYRIVFFTAVELISTSCSCDSAATPQGQKINSNNRIERRNSRFLTISSLPREPSPTHPLKWPERNRVQITRYTSGAYHNQQHVLRTTWYEGAAQLLSLTELKSHSFELYFIG